MEEVIPFFLGAIVLLIPIVAILTSHQQRMAQILHGAAQPHDDALRKDVQDLKNLVHQQALLLDSLVSQQAQIMERLRARDPGGEPLPDRLGQNS
ncbi:MAG TPA: hypothetical protein VM328_09360 [Fimbriimonadaceae bacterium]|nr:hypothetical protein [Fimbriimonadaceae bacterium]